jgi:ubiquinone/menaquinone biosynthesis C-methylase UbiE
MDDAGYLFDNASDQAPVRFAGLEAVWDSSTIRYLDAIGIGAGWNCWEVGAGGGSIATWLADQVGPMGHVLATDIDVQWVPRRDLSTVTIANHDVVHDPIPMDTYDVVHARLVLVHLPERVAVLRALVGALKPGGHLLVEDFDAVVQDGWETQTPADTHFRRVHRALQELLRRRGGDIRYARRLPRMLADAGLADVAAEGRFVLGRAARRGAEAMRANFVQARAEMVAAGLVSDADVDRAIASLDGADFPVLPLLLSAWGRRPG